ncbi:51_t:CDS:2, partial [Acaulospora colombiana]
KGVQDRIGKLYWKIHEDYLYIFEVTEGKMIEITDENCEKIERFLKKYRSYSFYEGYNLKILKLLESTQIRMDPNRQNDHQLRCQMRHQRMLQRLRRRYQRLSRELEMKAHVGLRELREYEYDLGVMQKMLQASQRELQEFENTLVGELERSETELKKYHMTQMLKLCLYVFVIIFLCLVKYCKDNMSLANF